LGSPISGRAWVGQACERATTLKLALIQLLDQQYRSIWADRFGAMMVIMSQKPFGFED
jgi:hypothetical protein